MPLEGRVDDDLLTKGGFAEPPATLEDIKPGRLIDHGLLTWVIPGHLDLDFSVSRRHFCRRPVAIPMAVRLRPADWATAGTRGKGGCGPSYHARTRGKRDTPDL
tara:strand:+ start:225 stop:536 length:312 start_codon:yes stop_codon:yes gene_type:complete